MQSAAIPGYRLSKAKRSTRILTTLGLISILSGLVFSVITTLKQIGSDSQSVKKYYLGQISDSQGTDLDQMMHLEIGKSTAELAEITHLHLIGGGMLLFMLCHLLSLSAISDKLRTLIYIISFFSFLLSFGLPWAIKFVAADFAMLLLPSIYTFIFSLLIASIIPIYEMWFSR